jgi:hypothetical protein
VAREDAAAAGNSRAGGYDEEAQIQDAINLSRAEAEFRQGVEGRGGTYEHGGGSGSAGLNPFQRMLRRAGSRGGKLLWWWKTITWLQVGEVE